MHLRARETWPLFPNSKQIHVLQSMIRIRAEIHDQAHFLIIIVASYLPKGMFYITDVLVAIASPPLNHTSEFGFFVTLCMAVYKGQDKAVAM